MLRLKCGLPFNPRMAKAASADAGEEGYILVAVLFLIVMVLITLSIATPKVAADIQRDREIELQHRGLQYRRAIQLYYRKFNAYPPNIDALVKTSEIRFLRKRYKDTTTGKDEWKLIHFGENKTPTAMGFFGQPMAGSTLAGTGPGGVGQQMGTPADSAFGSNGAGTTAGGSAFGGSSFGSSGSSAFGSGSNSGSASGGSSATGGTTDTTNTTGATGTTGTTATDPSATSGGTTASTFGGSGQTFGGGGIIGVESTSAKATILEYKKKKHFNEWEFTYDPASERQMLSNNTGIGQPVGGPGNSTSPFGNSSPGLGGAAPPDSAVPPQGDGGGTAPPPPQQNPNQQQ